MLSLDEVYQYIEVSPTKGRESVFWGTRIRPEHIIDDFAKGMTPDEILKEHPQLTLKHLEAAIVYQQSMPTDKQLLLYLAAEFFTPPMGP